MARGDMKMTKISVNLEAEILNRKEFEATPMTIDFADVTDTADNGEKIVKAGMPIDKDGKPVKTTPWTGAVGILLHDAYESRPQQQVLKKAYINVTRAKANCGLTYDAALVAAMVNAGCRIVFEEGTLVGTVPAAGS